jgi:hypothetical protein
LKTIEVLRIAIRNPIVARRIAEDGALPKGATPEQVEEAALAGLAGMRAEDPAAAAEMITVIEQIATEIYERGFRAGAKQP